MYTGESYRYRSVRLYRLNCTFELVQLSIYVVEDLGVVDFCALEQLISLEGEDAGSGQLGRIPGLEVNEVGMAQGMAGMIDLASL